MRSGCGGVTPAGRGYTGRMETGSLLAGRFEVERRIARGGMAEVYRARDRFAGGTVALKVLEPHEREHSDRFAREASVLAQLRHPAIVRYVAHGALPSGKCYLAMEWIEGETLTERLRRTG